MSHLDTDYLANIDNTSNVDGMDISSMAKNVYEHLNDEISKAVFNARMGYAMTGDIGAITSLDAKYRNLNTDMQVYAEKIQKGAHVIVYGSGVAGHYLVSRFMHFGVKVDAFIDQDETKGIVDAETGISIIKEKDLYDNKALYGDKVVVISYPVVPVAMEIKKRLKDDIGLTEAQIAWGVFDFRNNTSQYFDYFAPNDNEVFVDCGCYDGGTCYKFVGWCGRKGYDQIYSFEADPANYENCKKLLEPLGKCELFNYGTARLKETVYFASKGFETSCIVSKSEAEKMNFEGVTSIETISLDEALAGKKVTFIKMDIEGAEYDALLGAEKLIKENRPRMAISVYHKDLDFIILADLVLKMHPDYRISFRHYGFDELETIMYVE